MRIVGLVATGALLIIVTVLLITGGIGADVASAETFATDDSQETLDLDEGWQRFTFPITDGLEAGDVRIEVTYTWNDPEAGDGRQRWGCQYFGSDPRDEIPFPSSLTCSGGRHDQALDTHAEVEGQSIHVAPTYPWCEADLCYPETMTSTFRLADLLEEWHFDAFREHDSGPAYLLLMSGGLGPDAVRAIVEADGIEVTVDSGSVEDTFTFYEDDFRHEVHVRAEVPGVSYRQGDSVLETALLDDSDRYVALRYIHGPWSYPDGSEPSFPVPLAVSDGTGSWRFVLPEDESLHLRADEPPLVMGTVLDLPASDG